MYKKYLWYVTIFITVISLIVISIGFVNALIFTPAQAIVQNVTQQNNTLQQNSTATSTNSSINSNSNTVNIMLLGDSIAKGTGDEKGKGIGGYLVDLLKSLTSKEIVVDNQAVDGAKIEDLRALVKNGKLDVNFMKTNIFVISIGGKELLEMQTAKAPQDEHYLNDTKNIFVADLREIIKQIRNLNKSAQIVMLGNYNPITTENTPDNLKYLHTWNYSTQIVLADDENAVQISTYDLFKNNSKRFLSKDNVNPNATGYQTIAYLINKCIESTITK